MNLQDYAKVLRARWVTVCVTALFVFLDALIFTLVTTPQYQASTRLYVSTSSGSTIQDLYSGNRLSQESLLSYVELITSSTLAQRTVDSGNLGISADSLRAKVRATAQKGTVLINVSVLDVSPTRARDLANAVSDEFVLLAPEFDPAPNDSARPDARIVVEQRAAVPTNPVTPN
ncbi:MAG: Wzz/FepE/Etk N-terminal domain-containing protein, partial [Akkermansiaceae bacterium]|nr:Wzz/FepE/Etk N-terminal domain-containing protein [Akkermansiaceae bacterium]